jgi:Mrp family chromosome partitioning ATPase
MNAPEFDLLRARLEAEVARPAVIAITSSTAEDGKEIAARGLASSLAGTGYPTLYIDTCSTSRNGPMPFMGMTLEQIGHQVNPDPSGHLTVLSLGDPLLQRTSSRRNIQLALEALRHKFDYIVVSTEHGVSSSFGMSIAAAADAVMATVRTGRREKAGDVRLSAALDRVGGRFLGVLMMDASAIDDNVTPIAAPAHIPDARRQRAQVG